MGLVSLIEQKLGGRKTLNITSYLVGGQIVAYVLSAISQPYKELLYLKGGLLLEGEFWRLLTFLFVPFAENSVLIFFVWYIYYLYGNALENEWGSIRYLIYLSIVYLGTVGASLLFPDQIFSNTYVYGSLFLAFAHLFPNFMLYLFFILPVKVKWLGYLAWAGIILAIITGTLTDKVLAIISVLNFVLFFGSDILQASKFGGTKIKGSISREIDSTKSFIKCPICKATEKDHKIFYLCPECNGELSYCEDHIDKHKHKS